MKSAQLKLENQLCFPVYTASRLITQEYQPYLSEMKLTYPQYLVLLVLWERDEMAVSDIAGRLYLKTNTITPILQRMENQGMLSRRRSGDDERKVIVILTSKGRKMKKAAASIPRKLVKGLKSKDMSAEDLTDLRDKLNLLIKILSDKP